MAKTIFNMADGILTPCKVHGTTMTLISLGDCTLQCDTWLGDDVPLNSPKHMHGGILHLVSISTTSPQSTSFCTSLRNFIRIRPPSAEKNDVMSIFKMADISHLGF